MIPFLVLTSVLALYAETALQLWALLAGSFQETLAPPLFLLLLSLLLLSVLVTNLSSLGLALRNEWAELGGRERRACVLLHVLQLGLLWRACRVCARYTRSSWVHATSLRLIHVSLTSVLYLILQARALLLLLPQQRDIESLPVLALSLVVSLVSCAVALGSYTSRHELHQTLVAAEVTGGRPSPRCRGSTGLVLLLLGTGLCLAARLGAFALLSAEHAYWALLPFCLHFSVQALVHLGLSRRPRGSSSGSPPPPPPHLSGPVTGQAPPPPGTSPSSSSSFSTPAGAGPKPSPLSLPGPVRTLFLAAAKTYLNTFDLVVEEDEDEERNGGGGGGGRVRCGYVLFYAALLVENLAMTAAWLLHSGLDHRHKLPLAVLLLLAFLLALGLKAGSCRCVAASRPPEVAQRRSFSDSPRVFTALQTRTTTEGEPPSRRTWSGGAEDCTRRNMYRGNTLLDLATRRDRADTGISLATVSSLASSGSRQGSQEQGRGRHQRCRSHTDFPHAMSAGVSDSVFKEALREQQKFAQTSPCNAAPGHSDRSRTHSHCLEIPDGGKALVTKDHQHHLHSLIRDHHSSPEIVWVTSLGTLVEHQDGFSFDDPILASRLVLESLTPEGPEFPQSCSSPTSRQKYGSHLDSHDRHHHRRDRNTPISKRQLLLADRSAPANQKRLLPDSRAPQAWGSKAAHDCLEGQGGGAQYRYMTRCSCRGSPSSTPRRRPGHAPHTRKTHSYGSAHRSHHHLHHRSKAAAHRAASLRTSDSNSLQRSSSKEADLSRVLRSLSLTSREGSLWADWASSKNPPRPPPPSSHTRVDSDSSLSSSSSSSSSVQRGHRSQCHHHHHHHRRHCHHGNDSSEQAATWPRRKRGAKRRQQAAGVALPQDAAVSTQKVVQCWLQGLHTREQRSQRRCSLYNDGQSRRRLSGRDDTQPHRLKQPSRFSDTLDDKTSDDDGDDDVDDEYDNVDTNKDSTFVPKRERAKNVHGAANSSEQNTKRFQHTESSIVSTCSSDEQSSVCSGIIPTQNISDFWSSENQEGLHTSPPPFTLTRSSAKPSSDSKPNSHRGPDFHYPSPPQPFPPHNRKVTWLNNQDMAGSRSRSKGHHQQSMSRSNAPGYATVPDSGVSLSTVQDSDGSRSNNTQGHSRLSSDRFVSSQVSSSCLRTQADSDLLTRSGQRKIVLTADVHPNTGLKATAEPNTSFVSRKENRGPIGLTLDVDESLV